MKIRIGSNRVVKDNPTKTAAGAVSEDLNPLLLAYAWKPKKCEALMSFIGDFAEYEKECQVELDEGNSVKCMAVSNDVRGAILLVNLAKTAKPIRLECLGMTVDTLRLIDNNRTDVVVPMLASLPPLSVLLIKCSAEKG